MDPWLERRPYERLDHGPHLSRSMSTVRRTVLLRAGAILICAFAAAFIARIAVRTPALWPLAPEPLLQLLVAVFQPSGQEAVADVEWLGFWLIGFSALMGATGIGAFLLRRSRSRP